MKNTDLISLVKKFKNNDMTVFDEIYEEFKKLIIFYSYRLNYEDAVQELNIFLIELLYKIDIDNFKDNNSIELNKYIAVSIRNQYIFLSKHNCKYNSFCNEIYEYMGSCTDNCDERIFMSEGIKQLSEHQKKVIIYKFYYDLSDVEISEMLGISRQAVNRVKNRVLEVLRQYFNSELM